MLIIKIKTVRLTVQNAHKVLRTYEFYKVNNRYFAFTANIPADNCFELSYEVFRKLKMFVLRMGISHVFFNPPRKSRQVKLSQYI